MQKKGISMKPIKISNLIQMNLEQLYRILEFPQAFRTCAVNQMFALVKSTRVNSQVAEPSSRNGVFLNHFGVVPSNPLGFCNQALGTLR